MALLRNDQIMLEQNREDVKNREFVIERMNNRQTDIHRFTQQANEQEFIICRFLVGWSIAVVAGIISYYLSMISTGKYVKDFLACFGIALVLLVLSIVSGLGHHFYFWNLLKTTAKNLDEKNRKDAVLLYNNANGNSATILFRQMCQEDIKEGSIKRGSCSLLYWQCGLFVVAMISIGVFLALHFFRFCKPPFS